MRRRPRSSAPPAPPGAADPGSPDLVAVFLRWVFFRAVLHNGWWLVTSVYLVVDARLTATQLVIIAVAQSAVALVFELPAGVLADVVSRRWSLVASQALMGTAMLATGLVTAFPELVTTQMLWGLSWNFASGADVAWITDELDQPGRISAVLVRSGRAQLAGAAAGIIAFGMLASVVPRATAMILAGGGMLVLGVYVWRWFPEHRFRASAAPLSAWSSVLRGGLRLARRSDTVLLMVAATALVNGAATAARLYQKRLVQLGVPATPMVWFAGLGVLTLLAGALALAAVESRVSQTPAALRRYFAACASGAVGVGALALAPERLSGAAAVVVVAGIAVPLTRTLSTVIVNRETPAQVRATVHSVLAQSEYVGEITGGAAIAVVAATAGLAAALGACAGLFLLTLALAPGAFTRGVSPPCRPGTRAAPGSRDRRARR